MPCLRTGSPSSTPSILMTSAPMSARNIEQKGPESILDRSTTRMPSSCMADRVNLHRLAEPGEQRRLALAGGLDVAPLHVTVAADGQREPGHFRRQRDVV